MQWFYCSYPYVLILLGLVLVAVYGFYAPSDYRGRYSLKSLATQAGAYLILGGFFSGHFPFNSIFSVLVGLSLFTLGNWLVKQRSEIHTWLVVVGVLLIIVGALLTLVHPEWNLFESP